MPSSSPISEMPGPDVDVNARAPAQVAPSTIPIEASSSSACSTIAALRPVSGSRRYLAQYLVNASIRDVEGVIGYQAATVAPAYRQPSAAAVLPSIRILSPVASIFCSRIGSGQSRFEMA